MHTTRYRRRRQTVDLKPVLGCLLAMLAAAVLLGLMYASTLNPKVDEHVLRVKDLPDNLRNLRIVYLSDIHYGRWFSRQQSEQLVQQINDLSADVVILGGDYGEDPAGAEAFFRDLPTIQSRNGVYAVMGDTDRSDEPGTLERLVGAMRSQNVTALVNDTAQIKLGKSYLYIAGADDYRTGFPDVEKVAARLNADDFVIFAAHSPNLLPAMLAAPLLIGIINKVKAENTGIKIFISTLLNVYTGTDADAVNADIESIASNTSDVYLMDISEYGTLTISGPDRFGHLTAIGYRKLAEYYHNYISFIIDTANEETFRFIQYIGTNHTSDG